LNDGSAYNVTVSTHPAGQGCAVINGSGNLSGADVVNVTVICRPNLIFSDPFE
jgi:hypothetical protein